MAVVSWSRIDAGDAVPRDRRGAEAPDVDTGAGCGVGEQVVDEIAGDHIGAACS